MVDESEKAEIRACMAAVRAGLAGSFEPRRHQLEVVATVAHALGACRGAANPDAHPGQNIAVVEAGTGTGKSLGALVPALVMARARGKKLVVASSTVALQYQYATKDAPTLARLLPAGCDFAIAKGRRRYACPIELNSAATAGAQGVLGMGEDWSTRTERDRDRAELMQGLARSLESGQWDGDRDHLARPVADGDWERITKERQACTGRRCPEFGHCPFFLARQRVREADLVIANHDLVLASLVTPDGSVLPPPEETMYIFDEAHHLPAKAVEQGSANHVLQRDAGLMRDLHEAIRDTVLGLRLPAQLLSDATMASRSLVGELEALHARFFAMGAFEEREERRLQEPLPGWLRDDGNRILTHCNALLDTCCAVRERLAAAMEANGPMMQHFFARIGFFLGRAEGIAETWSLMLAVTDRRQPPVARWVERIKDGDTIDFRLCAAPVSAAPWLSRVLWDRASAAVLMSATLTSGGSFSLFKSQSGLARFNAVRSLSVGSPFDYAHRAELVVDGMSSDPTDAALHTAEIIERLPSLITSPGTLVLFASGWQMRTVYEAMPIDLRGRILVQGALSKLELLRQHRMAIDAGKTSVIFGLQTFSEGVDLPGEYCTHVICAKLPFSVPDSPMEETRRDWIKSQGRSAFTEVSLPEAALRFKQQVGRLLRTTQDYGRVTVLDRRLVSKRWGREIMRELPPFAVSVEPPRER